MYARPCGMQSAGGRAFSCSLISPSAAAFLRRHGVSFRSRAASLAMALREGAHKSRRPLGLGPSAEWTALHHRHACFRIWPCLSRSDSASPVRRHGSGEDGRPFGSLIYLVTCDLAAARQACFPQPSRRPSRGFSHRQHHGIAVRGPDLGVHHPAAHRCATDPAPACPNVRCASVSPRRQEHYQRGAKGVSAVAKSFLSGRAMRVLRQARAESDFNGLAANACGGLSVRIRK